MAIKKGDKVKISYKGTLEDGTVFDDSEKHGPIEFEVGAGQVIKGFDNAVIGMEKGEEKEIKISPEDAYGERRQELMQKVPADKLPPEAKKGSVLMLQSPDGAKMPVKIAEMEEHEATIDLNHPLAGKTLSFKIKVVEC